MTLLTAYLVIFAAGPLVFMGLVRHRPGRDRFAMNSAAAIGFLVVGMLLWQQPGQAAHVGALLCLWLGWVVMAAVAVQAVWLREQAGAVRRATAALGAAATVIPWFGLSLAVG